MNDLTAPPTALQKAMAEHERGGPTPLVSILQARYSMSESDILELKRAGNVAVRKLVAIMEHPSFDKLPVTTQLRVIDQVMDRAYGKAETASSAVSVLSRAASVDSPDAVSAIEGTGGSARNERRQIDAIFSNMQIEAPHAEEAASGRRPQRLHEASVSATSSATSRSSRGELVELDKSRKGRMQPVKDAS